jgi:CRP-like cAMP-binding protein
LETSNSIYCATEGKGNGSLQTCSGKIEWCYRPLQVSLELITLDIGRAQPLLLCPRWSLLYNAARVPGRPMLNHTRPGTSSGNRLLARLHESEYQRLIPALEAVSWGSGHVLYEARAPIDFAYFPTRGTASALTIMEDGSAIEVATIGNEGIVGMTLAIGAEASPNKVIVQVPGAALRMKASAFKKEAAQDGPFRRLLYLYHSAFLTQVSYSVACNGLHSAQQRCCRWLLMTQDRSQGDKSIRLTHEFLGFMLGVRRSTVTDVLQPLQDAGIIRNGRGEITILDRPRMEAECCECYRQVNEEYDRLFAVPRDDVAV